VQVKWLSVAIRNLDAAMEYVVQENPEAANEMYAYIRERVAALAKRPEKGRPGRVFGTRELVLEKYPYIVPYTVREKKGLVLRVFHTAQKPPKRWESPV